jgi:nitroimidazol reductase NimA-like FMN-containing flavoprotein (pyridoxamine 5'-phosphate oxidase superfamily)
VGQPQTHRDYFMTKEINQIKSELRRLLHSQPLAVLATQGHGQPYASLVAFSSSDDLKSLYFATTRSTRKFANLLADSRVALLVDNRSNRASDFRWAMAATATGRAGEVDSGERANALGNYLAKHPQLRDFVHSPTCALCRIRVQAFVVVTHFQDVVEVHISQ